MSNAGLLLKIEWTRELVQLVSNFWISSSLFQSNFDMWGLHLFRIRRHTSVACVKKHKQYLSHEGCQFKNVAKISGIFKHLWHIKCKSIVCPGCCTQFRRDISSFVVKQHRHTCDIETKRGQLLSLRVLQDLLKSTILEGFKGRNYVEGNKHVLFPICDYITIWIIMKLYDIPLYIPK